PRIKAAIDRAHPRSGRLTLPRAVACDLRTQDARHVRRRSVSLRDRGEPGDVGADGALHVSAGDRASAHEAGGILPGGHHDEGRDLIFAAALWRDSSPAFAALMAPLWHDSSLRVL